MTVTAEVLVSASARRRAMEEDVRRGMAGSPRSIPPVWFYDEEGSLLFDRITRLPEYYPTRAERSILEAKAGEIARRSGADTLVEIGSGTSDKTRLILDAMAAAGQLHQITLLDISEEVLRQAAEQLSDRYRVDVHAVVGDLRMHLDRLARGDRRLWAFLGSTIGNFDPQARAGLLRSFSAAMAPGDSLLLGTDLVKDTARLVAAYDDAEGVTARFNLNVLNVLNRELGADFATDQFEHRALWNEESRWIEMRLRSRSEQKVTFAELGAVVLIGEGEEILTEISAKFDAGEVAGELAAVGLVVEASYLDGAGDFLLTLARK